MHTQPQEDVPAVRYLCTSRVRAAFGFKSKIPLDFMSAWRQLDHGLFYRISISCGGNKHRVLVRCPECQKPIPVGRLHQHWPVHGARVPALVEISNYREWIRA